MLYHSRGKLNEAEAMLKRALAGFEKMEILEDKAILDTYYVLGVLYKQSLRLAEAVMVFQHAATGYEKLLGPQDPVTLNLASYNGHVEVVKILLEKGADVNVVTKGG